METVTQKVDELVAIPSLSHEVALKKALDEAMNVFHIEELTAIGLKDGIPTVTFCISNLDRDVTEIGVGEVFFLEDRAGNDQGWCEGDSVLLLPTEAGFAVLDASHGCPEYCDDQADASMSGTAHFFADEESARAFAQDRSKRERFRYCAASLNAAVVHGVTIDAALVGQSLVESVSQHAYSMSEEERRRWLAELGHALLSSAETPTDQAAP